MSGISSDAEPMEVPVPVPALVMMADAGAHDLDVRQVADDRVAERDVLLDDVGLGLGQATGLAQDAVRDADLSDVVEQPGQSDRALELVVHAETARDEAA